MQFNKSLFTKIRKLLLLLFIISNINDAYAFFWENRDESLLLKLDLFSENIINSSHFELTNIPLSAFHVLSRHQVNQKHLDEFCQKVDYIYKKLLWKKSPCTSIPLTFSHTSEKGNPIVYWDFIGAEYDVKNELEKNVTLILGGVHPDELTPVHLAFKFAEFLVKNPQHYKTSRVIIAPLINPDGFFANPPKRTNANGVDLNRNFPTSTWAKYAYQAWKNSKKRDPRKFPGYFANSEIGTQFQAEMIEKFSPNKLISIHAPLAFLDLDFEIPNLKKNLPPTELQKRAQKLARLISKSSGNYKIRNYGVYPGSLGNYAGNERIIPTITLELSSSNPRLVNKFWSNFAPGLLNALKFEFKQQHLADLSNLR